MGEPVSSEIVIVDLVRMRIHLRVFRNFIGRADSAHYRNYVLDMFDDFRPEIEALIAEAEASRAPR